MMPPKPPRKSLMMKSTITSPYDFPQPTYEDPDVSLPAVVDESQSEVKVKPVPRPRLKSRPKVVCSNNNNNDNDNINDNDTVDSADKDSNTTNAVSSQLSENHADYKTPRPARPPPPAPPMSKLTSSKPTAAVNGGNHNMNSNTETTLKPPAVSTDRKHSPPPPRPQRPPPPSLSYYGPPSTMRPKPEISYDESQQSRHSPLSSTQLTPVSPIHSEETLSLYGTFGLTAPDRPAVPPRLGQSSLPRPASVYETAPPQTRPPVPQFKPPPPPSVGTLSESVYSEIEYRPYVDVLPEDDDVRMTQGWSTLHPGQRHQSGTLSSSQRTTDSEDINVMLRWLKRVSKSDVMAVYGLSIEEEIRSFDQRAKNVRKALRLYNLLMMKRNEGLRDIITEFNSISNCLDKMQKTTKTVGIAGGTTGAVGGVTAVLGIALAPVTFGTSLIATAVGAGMVASAGGLGIHATNKANKKIVCKMTVEKLVYGYKENVVDLEHCLDFILCGMNELRRHDIPRLQRAGAQPDALQMAHLSQSVMQSNMNNNRKVSVAHTGGMSSEKLLTDFILEMDQYFAEKEGEKLRKSSQSKFSGRVRLLAKNLQDELDHLNHMWQMFS